MPLSYVHGRGGVTASMLELYIVGIPLLFCWLIR